MIYSDIKNHFLFYMYMLYITYIVCICFTLSCTLYSPSKTDRRENDKVSGIQRKRYSSSITYSSVTLSSGRFCQKNCYFILETERVNTLREGEQR